MATITNVPVSQILRSQAQEAEDEPKKKSREDWRKAKELEEARKAGTAPAAVDEEGKDINPHIPQYISSAPWYFGSQGPTLKHQRIPQEQIKTFSRIDEWYKRGVDTSKVVTKYRLGACENCGALTHKKKDCLDRPRKVGAKYSAKNIAPDEFSQVELSRDYDGKRDRWAGYDPSQHTAVIERFNKIEDAKREIRSEKLKQNDPNKEEVEGEDQVERKDEDLDSEDEDDDKYVDAVDMPGTKVDSKQRITVRNLRIREDTAKYLRNLDPNSAYYDPKTRSMRDNPYEIKLTEEVDYAGENFVRVSGDTRKHAKAQSFAWEAYEKGVEVHPLGEPTKLELLQKEFEEKRDEFKKNVQNDILEKYGGEKHLDAPPKELLLAQTEYYAEYTRYGTKIKGDEKTVIRSKYEEDVFVNNHTTVWGSFWKNGFWGYKCCHSSVKGSYCTGEAGRQASMASDIPTMPKIKKEKANQKSEEDNDDDEKTSSSSDSDSSSSSSDEEEKLKSAKKKKKNKRKKDSKKKLRVKGKDKKEKSEEEKLKEALQKEEELQKEADRLLKMDERKRPYNSMVEIKEPTALEMEAYYLKRKRADDPMADFL